MAKLSEILLKLHVEFNDGKAKIVDFHITSAEAWKTLPVCHRQTQ